jgi:hypothetical protein
MRFRLDRRWATLVVAVVLGAVGGSVLGFVTAPGPSGDARELAPAREAATPTTRRPRGRIAGISSTTRPRPRPQPATSPSTTRPATTTTRRPTSTTREPTTTSTSTTTTAGQGTTSSTSSSTLPASSTT